MEQGVSVSGIRQKADGTREVPSSQRPDGTVRATIRIRPGFVPAADKPKYKPPRTRAPTRMDETVSDKLESLSLVEAASQLQARSEEAKANDSTIKGESTTLDKSKDGDPSAKIKTGRPVEAAPVSTASKTLLAWSTSAWKNKDDAPSRYASVRTVPTPSPPARVEQVHHTENTNVTKTGGHKSRSRRKTTSHKMKSDKVEEEVLDLEAELRKVNLST